MTFKEALKAMKRGAKVRLPGWLSYYWYWEEETSHLRGKQR